VTGSKLNYYFLYKRIGDFSYIPKYTSLKWIENMLLNIVHESQKYIIQKLCAN
jgi:hypothetical protein